MIGGAGGIRTLYLWIISPQVKPGDATSVSAQSMWPELEYLRYHYQDGGVWSRPPFDRLRVGMQLQVATRTQ